MSAAPGSLTFVGSPPAVTIVTLTRVWPATGTATASDSPAAVSSSLSRRPSRPPAVTTARVGTPRRRSTRLTLTPLPLASAVTPVARCRVPGRSVATRYVRSTLGFGVTVTIIGR